MINLYDYCSQNGRNVISEWSRELSRKDRAKFDVKTKALAEMDFQLAMGTKLLQGPIYKHIYKLKIHGEVMLRPLLCRGPIDNETEYTFLAGAKEVNFQLVPQNVSTVATARRSEVIADPNHRRCAHVRF